MKKSVKIIFGSIVGLIVLVAILPKESTSTPASATVAKQPDPKPKADEQLKHEAFEEIGGFYAAKIAERAIVKSMKPRFAATAHFSTDTNAYSEMKWTDSVCEMRSYVEYKNDLGIDHRDSTYCLLRYKGGDMGDFEDWQVLKVKVSN